MRLLLTGADGFTGININSIASRLGIQVLNLKSNLLDNENLKKEVASLDFTHILHLAGIAQSTLEDYSKYYNGNVEATKNLLLSIKNYKKLKKIIIASSATVYGRNSGMLDEVAKTEPINYYAKSKLEMEKLILNDFSHLPIIITRPFNYTGKHQTNSFVIPKIVQHFKDNKSEIILGNIEVFREFNDVRYVAEIYLKLLSIPESNFIINICTGKSISIKQVLDTISEITKKTINFRINNNLIRKNDPLLLCGNPNLLISLTGVNYTYDISDTLKWMLYD